VKSTEAATHHPPADSISLVPDDLVTLYTGDDGHLYLAEGDGRRTERLSWSSEDFSTIPGLPVLPGVTGDLEDGHVFAHPTPSTDGQRIAVFGLLPTFTEDDDYLPPWDQLDEALEHLLAETFANPEPGDPGAEPATDDIAGSGMVLVMVGDEVESDIEELLEAEPDAMDEFIDDDDDDDELPAFWPGSKVYVIHRDGVQVSEPWEAEDGTPIHLDWAPDDQHLLVLHQQEEILQLDLVDTDDPGLSHCVATGAPLFWAWQPGDTQLAIRAGDPDDGHGLLHLADPIRGRADRIVGPVGAFYTPAWHPTGQQFLYSKPGEREDILVEVDADGYPLRELLTYPGRAAFRWNQQGERIALAVAPEGHGPFDILQILEADGRARPLFRGAFLSFHWLHDGTAILICSAYEEAGHLQWALVGLDGSCRTLGPAYAPTRETVIALHFFEQVASSHPFLSADGRHIVYSGYPVDETEVDGIRRSLVEEDEEAECGAQIMTTPIDGGPTVAVGEGRYGCFGNRRSTRP